MKKKRLLAFTLAASMVFSNVLWAEAAEQREVPAQAEAVLELPEGVEASPSNAQNKASVSNAAALLATVGEDSVQLQIDSGKPVYSGQTFELSMKVGTDIPDSAYIGIVIKDAEDGVCMEINKKASRYRTLKSVGTGALKAGSYTMYAYLAEGEQVVSDIYSFDVLRADNCYVEFTEPLSKAFGKGDPGLDDKGKCYTAYINGEGQEQIPVKLLNAEYTREPGEASGEYKITGIQSPDYLNIYIVNNEFAKLVIGEDKAVQNLSVENNYSHYVKLTWETLNMYPIRITKSNVYRAEEDGEFKLLKSLDWWIKSCTDTTAEKGKTYRYKVTAILEGGASGGIIESGGQSLEVKVSDKEIVMPSEKKIVRGESEKAEIQVLNFDQIPNGKWTSSQEDVLSVDTEGKVTAQKRGEAVITFTLEDGYAQSTKYTCIDKMLPPSSSMFNSQEWKVFTITNQNRMDEGHLPLTMVPLMQKATDIRKQELLTKYAHIRPNGDSCFTVFGEVRYDGYTAIGENIAMGQGSPASVMNAWMNSSGHYANIMDDDFEHFATGAKNSHWVQMFSGCTSGLNHMELLLPKDLTFKKGTEVEDFGVIVAFNCTAHGASYMPLISQMCTGYDSGTDGGQTITVEYGEFKETFDITVKGGSSSGGGGSHGGGGGSSSGGGGGGGSSSGGGGGGAAGGLGKGPAAGGTASLPAYVIKGIWSQAADFNWKFTDSNGVPYINKWAAIENPYANTALGQSAFDWFYFDVNGNMVTGWHQDGENLFYLNQNSDGTRGRMVTGWFWIPDQNGVQRCYYFNPVSDGTRGKLIRISVIDGSTVNANGEWVVNGVVQTK